MTRALTISLTLLVTCYAFAGPKVSPQQISERRARQKSDLKAFHRAETLDGVRDVSVATLVGIPIGLWADHVAEKIRGTSSYARGEHRDVADQRLSAMKKNTGLRAKGLATEKWSGPTFVSPTTGDY